MGFSIRSELASYARLKRRCYFLFVISYGGLLAGLTYAAMTHQSPPLWIGLIPGAALSVPLLLLPTQSWLPCLFTSCSGSSSPPSSVPGGKRTCRSSRPWSWAPWRGWPSSTPFISCAVRWKKKAHSKNTPRIRGGRAPKRRRNEVRRPLQPLQLEPCSKPFRLQKNQASPRGAGRAEKYGERAAESGEE